MLPADVPRDSVNTRLRLAAGEEGEWVSRMMGFLDGIIGGQAADILGSRAILNEMIRKLVVEGKAGIYGTNSYSTAKSDSRISSF